MGKIIWSDLEGNDVDYDFVLELGGTESKRGVPLAFFETFWRRGARHSKDKARDDSGKLIPMRDTYPTVRILGIISAGDFTQPAQELVRSRAIDLFYIPKAKICKAWEDCKVPIDYADSASESVKRSIADNVENKLTNAKKKQIHERLISIVGKSVFDSFLQRIVAGIAAVPVEFRVTSVLIGKPIVFNNHEEAEKFLQEKYTHSSAESMMQMFRYEVVFSDGNIFQRADLSSNDALSFHRAVGTVAGYFKIYHANKSIQAKR
ncbi:MAG: hypothetical protein F6K14_28775 [Symploca sp. SIO2C1]|nr:hypothetical protein [Symploca sp. SIO2C1]